MTAISCGDLRSHWCICSGWICYFTACSTSLACRLGDSSCYSWCRRPPRSGRGYCRHPLSLEVTEHWGIHQNLMQNLRRLVFSSTTHCNHWWPDQVTSFEFCRTSHYASSYSSRFLWSSWCSWPRLRCHGRPYHPSAYYTTIGCPRTWPAHSTGSASQHIIVLACIPTPWVLWTKDVLVPNWPWCGCPGCIREVSLSNLAHQC